MTVRDAVEADAQAIARIYNQGIEEGTATFETEPRTADDIASLLIDRRGRHPMVVAEQDGQVFAWAGTSPYRDRPCYDGVAEVSVYTDHVHRRSGAGRAVMEELLRQCEGRGLWKLVSRIFPENAPSRALCRSLGFREVGIYRRHARLDGAWKDCVIVEKLLGEAAIA
jgi:phosphinothricin acetyltransferase